LLDEVERRHGALHGIVHAAGVLGGRSIYRPLTEIGGEESEDQFRPKVYGLYALERALAGRRLDFCLLFSSNAAVLGGLGFVAYAAANAFMDAFAADRERSGAIPWISSNWDEWPSAGATEGQALQTSMSEFVMTPEESTDAFERVLTRADGGQIVVSTGDLESRLRLWVARTATRPGAQQVLHPRPDLKTSYLQPRNDTERRIAEMWGELLGIEQVGISDNFFDLGGHSLLATQLLSRLREAFAVECPLQQLFAGPTVAELADAVLKARVAVASAEQLSEILGEIRGLSDEAIERRLAANAGGKKDVSDAGA
jgi:acyl carrier protein